MEKSAVDFFATQGPWALLFVVLLGWVLRENSEREKRLIAALEALQPAIDVIAKDVDDIKQSLGGM